MHVFNCADITCRHNDSTFWDCAVALWLASLIRMHLHGDLGPAWGTVRTRSLASLFTLSFFVLSLHPVVLCPVASHCRSLSCRFTLSFSVLSLHPVVLCPVSLPCRSLSCLFTLSFFVLSLHPVVICPVSPMSEDAGAWC